MANEFTFDVVSKIDFDEVKNAVAQATKEIAQRFDFKGSVSKIDLKDEEINSLSPCVDIHCQGYSVTLEEYNDFE